jgi:hypothetical protein
LISFCQKHKFEVPLTCRKSSMLFELSVKFVRIWKGRKIIENISLKRSNNIQDHHTFKQTDMIVFLVLNDIFWLDKLKQQRSCCKCWIVLQMSANGFKFSKYKAFEFSSVICIHIIAYLLNLNTNGYSLVLVWFQIRINKKVLSFAVNWGVVLLQENKCTVHRCLLTWSLWDKVKLITLNNWYHQPKMVTVIMPIGLWKIENLWSYYRNDNISSGHNKRPPMYFINLKQKTFSAKNEITWSLQW